MGRKGLTGLRVNLAGFAISPCLLSSEQRDFLLGGAVAGAVLQGHFGVGGQGSHRSLTHPEDAVISPGLKATVPGHRNSQGLGDGWEAGLLALPGRR